jgi:hypothetical protein
MQSCTGTNINERSGSLVPVRYLIVAACRILARTAEAARTAAGKAIDGAAVEETSAAASRSAKGLHTNSVVYRSFENEYRILPHRTCRLTAAIVVRLSTML